MENSAQPTLDPSSSSSSVHLSQAIKRPFDDTEASYQASFPTSVSTNGIPPSNTEISGNGGSSTTESQPPPPPRSRRRRFETATATTTTTTTAMDSSSSTFSNTTDGTTTASSSSVSVDTTVQSIESINAEIIKLETQIKTLRNAVGITENQRDTTIQAIEQILQQKRQEIIRLGSVASSKLHLPTEALNNPALTAILASLNKSLVHSSIPNVVLPNTILTSTVPTIPVINLPVNNRIYVGSLHYDLTEADLRMVFSPFGKIKNLDIVRDSATGRSRGYAFISFETDEAADVAISTMNGYQLAGRPIRVNRPVPSQGSSGGGGGSVQSTNTSSSQSVSSSSSSSNASSNIGAHVSNPNLYAYGDHIIANMVNITEDIHTYVNKLQQTKPGYRIYIGAIPYELTASHIKQIFAPFGALRSVILLPSQETNSNATNAGHRGYGFIEYEDEKAGKDAIDNMNGFEISGRKLKVGQAASTSSSSSSSSSSFVNTNTMNNPMMMAAVPNAAAALTSVPANNYLQMTSLPNMGLAYGTVTGMVMNSSPPVTTTITTNISSLPVPQVPTAVPSTVMLSSQPPPSRIIAIRNMVTIDDADDPDLPDEIKEEAEKVGKVEHVHIYKHRNQQNVTVFIIYNSVTEAQAGIQKLDKRYFGGRVTSAVVYPEEAYQNQQYE